MTLSMPAAFKLSINLGRILSGSTLPVSRGSAYWVMTFPIAATSVLTGVGSKVKPSAFDFVADALNSFTFSHMSGAVPFQT
ncbi:hypothetical protein D3C71_1902940 [compost metagenome]